MRARWDNECTDEPSPCPTTVESLGFTVVDDRTGGTELSGTLEAGSPHLQRIRAELQSSYSSSRSTFDSAGAP